MCLVPYSWPVIFPALPNRCPVRIVSAKKAEAMSEIQPKPLQDASNRISSKASGGRGGLYRRWGVLLQREEQKNMKQKGTQKTTKMLRRMFWVSALPGLLLASWLPAAQNWRRGEVELELALVGFLGLKRREVTLNFGRYYIYYLDLTSRYGDTRSTWCECCRCWSCISNDLLLLLTKMGQLTGKYASHWMRCNRQMKRVAYLERVQEPCSLRRSIGFDARIQYI